MTTQAMARPVAGPSWDRVVVAAGSAAIAGLIAGVLVGGIGSRLAMRVAGALTDASLVGVGLTNNGNVVGTVTVGGSLVLLLFGGLIPGVFGGASYAAARPWLDPLGRWAGLGYGLAILAALGRSVIEPFNIDFQRFGVPALNAAMFALLFPLFGVVLGIALPRLDRWTAGAPAGTLPFVTALVGALLLAAMTILGLASAVGTGFDASSLTSPQAVFAYFLAAPVALRLALGRGRPLDDLRGIGRPALAATYGSLLAPAVLGAPATIDAILFVAR